MAQIETIDKTGMEGSETFPLTTNDVMNMVETLASQNIRGLKSANMIDDGLYYYDVEDGKVIEESVIEMAKKQTFDKSKANFAPNDPAVHPKYFNNYESAQYRTTVRRNDIRKILANKGVGVEQVVSEILDTLNQGEGHDAFLDSRALIFGAPVKDYALISGHEPKNMRGVLQAARDMYNHLRADNSDCTSIPYVSSTPESDIRIAISVKLLNLIDVSELAHTFNIAREELFGRLVPIPVDDMTDKSAWYRVVVYDRKAMGKARRLFEYSQDVIGSALYTNHYLTVENAYFYNGLFKGCFLDCSAAAAAAMSELANVVYPVTNVFENVTSDNAAYKSLAGAKYEENLTAEAGFKMDGATVKIEMGGADITGSAYAGTKVSIAEVTGPVVISAKSVAE